MSLSTSHPPVYVGSCVLVVPWEVGSLCKLGPRVVGRKEKKRFFVLFYFFLLHEVIVLVGKARMEVFVAMLSAFSSFANQLHPSISVHYILLDTEHLGILGSKKRCNSLPYFVA